jgi:hypothetical protein
VHQSTEKNTGIIPGVFLCSKQTALLTYLGARRSDVSAITNAETASRGSGYLRA